MGLGKRLVFVCAFLLYNQTSLSLPQNGWGWGHQVINTPATVQGVPTWSNIPTVGSGKIYPTTHFGYIPSTGNDQRQMTLIYVPSTANSQGQTAWGWKNIQRDPYLRHVSLNEDGWGGRPTPTWFGNSNWFGNDHRRMTIIFVPVFEKDQQHIVYGDNRETNRNDKYKILEESSGEHENRKHISSVETGKNHKNGKHSEWNTHTSGETSSEEHVTSGHISSVEASKQKKKSGYNSSGENQSDITLITSVETGEGQG